MQCKTLTLYFSLVLEIEHNMKRFPMQTFFPYEFILLLGSNQQPDWISPPPPSIFLTLWYSPKTLEIKHN